MKETGIMMSGNHPKLVMDGIKTQTRRVITHQPPPYCDSVERLSTGAWNFYKESDPNFHAYLKGQCPYGQVGDRLWVRETHYKFGRWQKNGWTKTGKQAWTFVATTDQVRYMDNLPEKLWAGWTREQLSSKAYSDWVKRPAIFMSRRDSRITLEITEVRVGRVQEINPSDILAEGYDPFGILSGAFWFKELWDSLNAKRGFGWSSNCFVWVLSFKEVK